MSDFMKPKHLCGSCEPTLIHFRKQSPERGERKGVEQEQEKGGSVLCVAVGLMQTDLALSYSPRREVGGEGVWSGLAVDRLCKPSHRLLSRSHACSQISFMQMLST